MTRTRTSPRRKAASSLIVDDDARSQRLRELNQKIRRWHDEVTRKPRLAQELQRKSYRASEEINRLYVEPARGGDGSDT